KRHCKRASVIRKQRDVNLVERSDDGCSLRSGNGYHSIERWPVARWNALLFSGVTGRCDGRRHCHRQGESWKLVDLSSPYSRGCIFKVGAACSLGRRESERAL